MSPTPVDFDKPLIPASYASKWIALLEQRGLDVGPLLAGLGLSRPDPDDPAARLSVRTMSELLARGAELAGDECAGFELGLSLKPTSHGLLGYALLSCETLREAVHLGERFIRVRLSPFRVRLFVDGDVAVVQFDEAYSLGTAREVVLQALAGAVVRIGELLVGGPLPHDQTAIWSDAREPHGFERVRGRLPPVHFGMPANQGRFPASWLDRSLDLGERTTLRELVETLERELSLVADEDVVMRVRALLADPAAGYPDLEAAAKKLGLSSRTLRRRLHQAGTTYLDLLVEARRVRATALLTTSRRSVEEIAFELGYADAPGFVRAFQKWTGVTPAAYRRERLG